VTAPGHHPAPGGHITREISHLIAWMRRLSDAGIHQADPAELAAFGHAKAELLARISHYDRPRPPAGQPGDPR